MRASLSVVVFDVNETLSDMSPMAERFAAVGAPAGLSQVWFASLLRDGFALTAVGDNQPFALLAEEALRQVLGPVDLDRDLDAAVEYIIAGFGSLGVHPDVASGVVALSDDGWRLVTLTNGSTSVAQRLLATAEIRDRFEQLLAADDAGRWKPDAAAYAYAAQACGVATQELVLVAVHPWDIHGAARARMSTVWLNRRSARYPAYFARPDIELSDLADLAERLRR